MRLLFLFPLLTSSLAGLYAQVSPNIRLNQVGFYTSGTKMAAVVDAPSATEFQVKSVDRSTTYATGTLGAAATWPQSGESVKMADFSQFRDTGTFVLEVPTVGYSYPFRVKDRVFEPLNKALIKAYYYNRTSTALEPAFAGKWARAAGHPDTHVVVHPSAASTLRPAGTILSSPKGWYDAGDYNSYIVNSGITTYTLLLAYEQYPSYYRNLNLNIPESGNSLPDLLDEIKWNLDWMLTMQDPNDGGVYNKKTSAAFSDFIMPEDDLDDRYVVTKSTSSAWDFAAVMAVAYRIYKEFDPTYASTCLEASKKAYQWGVANPTITFSNPRAQNGYPAIGTGGYGDGNLSDELEWASNELYIATHDESYYAKGFQSGSKYSVPDWGNVRILGLYSLLHHRKNLGDVALADTTRMKDSLLVIANGLLSYQKNTSPYKIIMGRGGNGDFVWGSNAQAANQAMLIMNAYFLTQNIEYANAALAQVDYLMGRNATGYSFVTGEGSKPVMNIHHRVSVADGIEDPVPGWLSGGPTNSTGDGCTNNTTFRAKSFEDGFECYTKNEIAINWNAPAAYITGALEYHQLFNSQGPTAIEDEQWLTSQIKVAPNPASDKIRASVQLINGTSANVYLVDMLGNRHKGQEVALESGENTIDLDVSQYPAGLYFLVIEASANRKTVSKVVINNK